MKLRLLLWEECPKRCPLCANRHYDLKALPVVDGYAGYEEIVLTGGEPMLWPDRVKETVAEIRQQTDAPVYMYTAWTRDVFEVLSVLKRLDGLTVSIHNYGDVLNFALVNIAVEKLWFLLSDKSLRLKIFEGSRMHPERFNLSRWQVERVKWLEHCPLPENEVFMRL